MMPRHPQQGFSLIVALVALVIMALAAVSLMRTVSTATLVSGNLAFEQAAVTGADAGTEAAIAWLENNTGVAASCPTGGGTTVLSCDQPAKGYVSTRLDPTSTQSWATVWGILVGTSNATPQVLSADAAGNTASYLIQRMCGQQGDASVSLGCSSAPSSAYCGNSKRQNSNAGAGNISCTSSTYYRITVQVSGPRGTTSYIQAMVAL
ncbi:hypothetical protein GT347_09230 [Xylophilus rhododendri]|uniref:Tfp pilus assembly protein PilX n=1 Tax=Xylophilus rhododendri TaxID=2697032 RepID=A0A857J2K5_9BURK|nr:hypothetical protein [Xylophilus rhododendri]QHI98154.1 hypothetical protein GT347_09230 [Xylophilus rhododendri]